MECMSFVRHWILHLKLLQSWLIHHKLLCILPPTTLHLRGMLLTQIDLARDADLKLTKATWMDLQLSASG
jgi:hypothetical protein